MKISDEIINAFYSGKRSDEIKFCVNDTVEIIEGQNVGVFGSVISIISLEPEVIYLIENGETGFDLNIQQNHLKLYIE